jgi:hypothetical protein
MGCETGVHASRSIADGQSQRSFSGHSAAKFLSPGGLLRPGKLNKKQACFYKTESTYIH